MSKKQKEIILSVCLTCTLNKAQNNNKLAGEKLAQKLIDKFKNTKNVTLRGVNCMSNCKRSCIVSFTAENCFTYVFGDIDPENSAYIDSIEELLLSYSKSDDGFLRRRHRPEIYRSNIVGRFPSINSKSDIISNLKK